ncbi:MAG: biopolymer transporter ExbD [Bacteroidales bacterium]|jgi:biopolymer transport protein ExbD|nr:biopolymer transporter ExbD [Bacteroidales bacterium]
MGIKTKYKRSDQFSAASMSDLVFLLLIFFILVSTLVSPNAIKLLLPSSNSKTMAKQTTTVYINENHELFIIDANHEIYIGDDEERLKTELAARITDETEASIVLRVDKSVEVQYIVNVIDAVNAINETRGTKHKVILATSPKNR